ncbi:MAG: nucleotidyltransferase domain-containing protein [Thermoplasmatota archaeon]
MDTTKGYAPHVTKVVSRFEKIRFAYLFGSILESSQFRDIDVALYLPAEMDSYRRIKYGMKVARETEKALDYAKEVDVRVINDAPVEFQYEVVKTGKVVFSRDDRGRIRFEAQVLSSYMDYRETAGWLKRELLEA